MENSGNFLISGLVGALKSSPGFTWGVPPLHYLKVRGIHLAAHFNLDKAIALCLDRHGQPGLIAHPRERLLGQGTYEAGTFANVTALLIAADRGHEGIVKILLAADKRRDIGLDRYEKDLLASQYDSQLGGLVKEKSDNSNGRPTNSTPEAKTSQHSHSQYTLWTRRIVDDYETMFVGVCNLTLFSAGIAQAM